MPLTEALQGRSAMSLARNIVNQLFDEAGVPVEKRQAINDLCDLFVEKLLLEWKGLPFCPVHGSIWLCQRSDGHFWCLASIGPGASCHREVRAGGEGQ